MFGISTYSEVPFSSLASSTFNGIAAINGTATVTVLTAGQFVYGTGSVNGTATLSVITTGNRSGHGKYL